MPWKNGGGTTTEIAAFPEGAGLDTFGWRISMARVEADGPFSAFPGIERTLSVIEGAGITLDFGGGRVEDLSIASEPLPFPGDAPVSAALSRGAITDLNVMTRRGVFSHRVEVIRGAAQSSLAAGREALLVLLSGGAARLNAASRSAALNDRDCLRLEARERAELALTPGARLYLISFRPAS